MSHKQKRQTEETMSRRAADELYQALFEQAADGIFIADTQGRYLEVNRQGCEMLGYSREELLNLSLQDLIPAEDLVSEPDRLAESGDGKTMLTESRLCCKDGRLLPVEIRGQMMADGRMLAFVRDITERRRAEEARHESEQKFRSFVEQSSEGFILIDEQGLIIEWNQAQDQMTGLRRAQVIGRPAWEVQWEMLPPEVRVLDRYERNKQTILEALRTGQSPIFGKALEAQVIKPDGTRRFFQQTVFPIKTDQGYRIGSISRDITEQQRADEQLRQLSRAVEQSPASIVITDTTGAIEYVNPKFSQVTGYTLAEVISQNPRLLKSGYTPPEEYQRLWAAVTSGGEWRGEFRNKKKNGDFYWEAATISPILNERGEITHFLAVKEDITERKRTEQALRESEEKFSKAFHDAPVLMSLSDLDGGRFLEVNAKSLEVSGFSRSEVIGKTPTEIGWLSEEDRGRIIHLLKTRGSISDLELCLRKKNGESVYCLYSGHVITIQGQKRLLSISLDITERKRAEQALRESEASLKISQQVAHVGHWTWDTGTNQVTWSDEMYRIFGLNPDSFTGDLDKIIVETIHPDDREKVIKSNNTVLTEQKAAPLEYRVVWPDQSVHTVWAVPGGNVIDASGKILKLTGIVQDITERKRAEEALREMAENMATAQRIAHFGSWEVKLTRDLEIIDPNLWSDECYRIFGFEPRSVQATSELFRSCLHPDDREFGAQMIFKVIRERTEISYEYRIVRPDGNIRYIHDQAKVVFDEHTGQPLKVVGTAHDITERKRAEETQAKLEEQLRQAHKMESVGRLAGGIAHDFNNLLTVIRGYCDLMQTQIPGGDPLRKDLEQIRRAGERAAGLTRQLLAFSRKQMLAPTSLDLNDLVTNLHKMLGRLIGEDINLVMVLQPGLWSVEADPGQIEQVIVNLAVNARDAMPTGGMLTIETHNVHLDDSYLKTHLEAPSGPCVMLAVTDTGHGMDTPTQAHIFEPFFTTKEVGQGTGLGLATAYGIIKQSGGDITVYSEPGHGTAFKIHLPASETASDLTVPQTPPTSRGGAETILLVEDQEEVRGLVGRTLRSNGYTVLEARHGGEALLLAGQHQRPIDLLLTDVVMPQMSGRELAEQLKTFRPQMKVLFMSGYTDDAVVRHGLLTAEVEFLPKPFLPDTLTSKVRQVLDK